MAAILVVFELVLHYALISFSETVTYSPMIPIVLLVMIRWGWPSIFYAVGDGILFCALNKLGWQSYLSYGVGNALVMLLLILIKFTGKERITSTWYYTALFVTLGWAIVFFGRAAVGACVGFNFADALKSQLWELLSLFIGILLLVIFRKLDGMLEDQKHYLRRLEDEKNERMRRDTYGDEPIDIDPETISILRKWDDGLGK